MMTNRNSLIEVTTLTDSNYNKLESSYSVLNSFSVIENLHITKGTCLKSESRPDAMSIFIVTKGSGRVKLNQREVDIQENNLVHLVTSAIHGASVEGQPFLISGVSFTSDFIDETEIMTELIPDIFSFFSSGSFLVWELEPEDTIIIKRQIRLLAEHAKKFATHPFGKEILVHSFYVFLFEIGALRQKHADSDDFPFSRQEIHVHKFKDLVQKQFREVRAIKDYAEQLNVSAKYLTEMVKRTTGKNASEMISGLVIKEAKYLLKNPQLSIGEIAYKLHFSDQAFFGKYFKRQTGVSPKTYRESEFLNKHKKMLMPA